MHERMARQLSIKDSMLLNRAQSSEARAALDALSRRFLTLQPSSVEGPSLASGFAGIALAQAGLDGVFPDRGHVEHARRALERALRSLATEEAPPGLHSGFTGVAWVSEVLQGDPSVAPAEDPLAPIDAALETYLDRSPWNDPYDLIEGLTGVGVYALERLPRDSAKHLLALVVERLRGAATRRKPGLSWRSDPEWVTPRYGQVSLADWNLGVAHGVPGVIAFLGRVVAADVDAKTKKRARALLDKAVAWTLAQELPADSLGCFAVAVAPEVPREPARLAWCYGDAGVAAALFVAAESAREPAWEEAALRVALRAAARPEKRSGINDASLCHGAAGVAHIFHRLFKATGEPRLARAARAHFAETLAMRRERGFGGFAAYLPDSRGRLTWRADPSFLTGAAGVTLALIAALLPKADTAWERALLIS